MPLHHHREGERDKHEVKYGSMLPNVPGKEKYLSLVRGEVWEHVAKCAGEGEVPVSCMR